MKALQAVALLLVGALGTMVYVRMNKEPEAPVATEVAATPTPTAPAVVEPAPVTPPAPEKKPAAKPLKTTQPKKSAPAMIASNREPAQSTPAPVIATPAPVVEPVKPAEPPPPPPPPPLRKVTLDVGTVLSVRTIETVSSDRNSPGDTFTASLEEPVVVDGLVIAEKGARVEGRIIDTTQAGRVKGLAAIGLELTTLVTSDGQRVAISTESFKKEAEDSKKSDAAKVGGGAALGAIIGAIAGGGKGAAIGAGVGGAAGTGGVLATRGNAAVVPSETRLTFHLSNSVTITEKRRKG